MTVLDKIHKLEQDLIQFKSSQAIGSSSSLIVPVGMVDTTLSNTGYLGATVICKFTTDKVINPIIMPRVQIYIDGAEVTHEDSDALIMLSYDDIEVATSLYNWGYGYSQPDEKTAAFRLYVSNNSSSTCAFRIVGTIYSTCEGNLQTYTHV